MVTALAVAVVGLSVIGPTEPAHAAVVQWGTNSGTAPNYQENVNGDFIMVGNGVLACGGAIANTVSGGVGTCADLHSITVGSNANNANDYFSMVNSNSVTGFTTNSSSATVQVPAGASVVRAYLNWSANTGVIGGVAQRQCANVGSNNAARLATIPSGSYTNRAVQLRVGGAAISSVAPTSMLVDPVETNSPQYYSATADVTGAFAGVATGTSVTVSAGNIWAAQGSGCYAGWSLALVYDYGTFIPGNDASKERNVVYYEGHVRLAANDAPLTVGFSGFTAVESGTRAGFTLYEGDRVITGDTAAYSRGGSTAYTEIRNANNATNNIGIGRAEGSVRYTQSGTGFTNQSVDVATVSLPNIVQGDTSVNLRLGTTGDSYLLSNAILSVPTPGLQVTKTAVGGAASQSRLATELAEFTITVTNSGAGTLRNIVVADDQSNCARALTGILLGPQQSHTYNCVANAPSPSTYVSTATATGYTVAGNYLAQDNDSTTVLVTAIALAKTSALAAGATGRAGDIVNYTFTATNTGSSALTGVVITDPLVGLSALNYAWPGAVGALAPGQSVTATATYALTQANVDAGGVTNTAAVTATDNDGGPRPTASATRTQSVAASGLVTVTKAGAYAAGATGRVGDRVNYSFTFTNTGNVTLSNLTINDPMPGLSPPVVVWPAAAGTLAPGQTATATANYTITQSNVDAGVVRNTATVTGRTPAGATVTGSSPQSSITTIPSAPALTTTKSGAFSSGSGGVGSVITYTVRTTNTGNVTLTDIAITDPLANLSALSYTWPGTAGTLAPGAVVVATANYTVTQADVDAGSVRNIATSTARTPAGATLTAPSTQSIVATSASAPAIALTKSGALATGSTGRAGDVVTYSFRLTNTGNVTLTGAGITDPLSGLSALTYTWPAGQTAGTLAPGQFVTGTATYTLRQADVDAGAVANTATATARPPTGASVSQVRSATVPIAPTGALTVLKSGTPSPTGGVGSTITYSFSATNNGNVTLTQVAIADPLPGLSTLTYTWPAGQAAGTLAPGQTVTASATYVVRQSDVDATRVVNTATASARTPSGATVTGTSPASSINTVAAVPAMTTVKSATVSGSRAVGDVVTYSFRTTNTGNVTLTNVVIADPLPGLSARSYTWPSGQTAGTLAPGQFVTATATYTIRQSDVNNGSIANTASSSASYGATPVVSTSNALTTATVAASSNMVVTKSGALASGATGRAGETVNWTITLRNSGNTTLTGVTATDSLPDISAVTYGTWPSGTAGTLQPGQTVIATATYVLKQSDVNAGAVSNTATGTATPSTPGGVQLTRTAPATVSLASAPGLTISKSGAYTSGAGAVGSVIRYTFSATNVGNVTLTNVGVVDPLAGLSAVSYTWPSGQTAGTLAPGQVVTGTATYTVVQTDVDAGTVRNAATATGTPPTGTAISASSQQVTIATVAAAPAITTTKSASAPPAGGFVVGSTITYTFRATNSGNVTLTGVGIADPKPGLSTLAYTWPTGQTANTLAPGQFVTATASYVVTQADVNAGSMSNTARASGSGGGTTVSANSPTVTTPTAASAPAITVVKTASPTTAATAGSQIDYSFAIRNAGNVTLAGVGLADPLPGLSVISFPTGFTGILQPGETATATASYTVRQSDVDAGSVANTATATGTPPTGAAVTGAGSATVTTPASPTISVAKTGTVTSGDGNAGSTVTWNFTIRNTGNVTLSSVVLSDSLPGLSAPVLAWEGGTAGTLRPGQAATGTATYTVRQADVDAGAVRNTASVTARAPSGSTASATSGEIVVATSTGAPAITLGKSAAPSTGLRVGDAVTYTFTVTNTGNQTVREVGIIDPKPGLSSLAYSWPGAAGVLAPGQSATALATYTVTLADVNSGSTTNTATASGTAPGAIPVGATSPTVTATAAAAAPSLTIAKSGALAPGSTGRAGDSVAYSFRVVNTGNVTISGVTVTDALPGVSAIAYPTGFSGALAPGQAVTATASYALTQSDVDSGSVGNVASVTGTPARGTLPSPAPTAAHTVPISSGPVLVLGKTGAYTSGSGAVGSVITYTFTARNAGNVTITDATISDPRLGAGSPITVGTLAPNVTRTFTASYTVTQADVNSGAVVNTATISGRAPGGASTTASSPTVRTATVAAGPALETLKSVNAAAPVVLGQTLTYTISARNTGNVTLTNVSLADPLPGLSTLGNATWQGGVPGTLQPNQTVSATATYTVTQADLDRGTIVNVATATGTPPTGAAVSAPSPTVTTTTIAAAPRLTVTKTGSLSADSSTIDWTIQVLNSGNVSIQAITLNDPLLGGALTPSATSLAPGAVATATGTSPVTQADVDAGSVVNTVTASGTPSRGAAVSGAGSATVPIAPSPNASLSKSDGLAPGATVAAGQTITYTYTAVNTGNVTLTGVTFADAHPGLSAITPTWPTTTARSLAPGQTATATATYLVTQADVDRGSIVDTAAITANPPTGAAITRASNTVTTATVAPSAALVTTKQAASGPVQVGTLINYTLTATNSGNVTLTGVQLVDTMPGLSPLDYQQWPGAAGVLAPGQSITATANYRVTQSDVNRGSLANSASSSGVAPGGAPVQGTTAVAPTTIPAAAPAFVLTKTGSVGSAVSPRAGDTVNFTFTLRNSGNVTLTGSTLSDDLPGLGAIAYSWPGAVGTLAPNQQVTAQAAYTLNQADVDAGRVENTVTASPVPARGALAPQSVATTVELSSSAALELQKEGTLLGPNGEEPEGDAGDLIRYLFTATNTGNVTLSGVLLGDPRIGLVDAELGALAPGDSVTFEQDYVVTVADIVDGAIDNVASVTATDPAGGTVAAESPPVRTETGETRLQLGLVKSASAPPAGGFVAGSTIQYTFTVSNSGNVPLDDVVVNDPRLGAASPVAIGALDPGAAPTAVTVPYIVTQTDVNLGSITNTAVAVGVGPDDVVVSSTPDVVTTPTVRATPGIVTSNAGVLDPGDDGIATPGDLVTWTRVITNTGNVTLTNVAFSESLAGTTAQPIDWPGGVAGTLQPLQSVTLVSTYPITQADIDAGAVASILTGTGTPPGSAVPISSVAPATVAIVEQGAVSIVKTLDPGTPGPFAAGETVTFRYVVSNVGTVTLGGIAVSDTLAGIGAITFPDLVGGSLAPGASAVGTASYTFTQADVDRGLIAAESNTATVTGTTPRDAPVSAANGLRVDAAEPDASLAVTKTVSKETGLVLGETITYTIEIRNDGDVTVSQVTLADELAGLGTPVITWPGTSGVLAPTQTAVAEASYRVTQVDIDSGAVTNVATASGIPARGAATVEAVGSVSSFTVAANPAITAINAGSLAPGSAGRAGDTVNWSYRVTNTGNVSLTSVTLDETLLSGVTLSEPTWPGAAGALLPGQSVTVSGTSILTQDDVDAGAVSSRLTGTGLAPGAETPIASAAPATVPVTAGEGLVILKEGVLAPGGIGQVGDTIEYTLRATNTGNVTLKAGTLVDVKEGVYDVQYPWAADDIDRFLAPNQTVIGTAKYDITQADVDEGVVRNIASAAALTPGDIRISAISNEVMISTVQPSAQLAVAKVGVPDGEGVGDTVVYTFTVTNTGNVTVTDVSVSDPLPRLLPIEFVPGFSGSLAPNESVQATATYTLDQADVDRGEVRNIATASGAPVRGEPTVTGVSPESVLVTEAPRPAQLTTNSGVLANGAQGRAGDVVEWSYSFTNTGNVTLTGVTLTESLGTVTIVDTVWEGGVSGVLAPGAAVTATGRSVLTQQDVDAGAVSSLLTGRGIPPRGAAVSGTAPATVAITPVGGLAVTKTDGLAAGETYSLGDVIQYGFTIENSGAVTLSGIILSDELAGVSDPVVVWPGAARVLAPGETAQASASYTVTQADVDAGTLANAASATGRTPANDPTVSNVATVVSVADAPSAIGDSLTIIKDSSVGGDGGLGDAIGYTFVVTNTGNRTLVDVTVLDELEGLSGIEYQWPAAAGVLAPTQAVVATAVYGITQADVDRGFVENTATASAVRPADDAAIVADPAVVRDVLAAQRAELTAVDTGALAPGSTGFAGDIVTWSYRLTNTGNVTLTAVTLDETLEDVTVGGYLWDGADGVLLPGQSFVAVGTYTLTQQDVDAGVVSSLITGRGTAPLEPVITTADATVTIAVASGLSILKGGALAAGAIGQVGDTIEYTLAATNTGNVTLTQGFLTDPLEGLYDVVYPWDVTDPIRALAPGETVTGTARYDITQADVDEGVVRNTATARAETPAGLEVPATSNTVVISTVLPAPGLTVTKSAAPAVVGELGDGAVLDYTFTIRNTGNVTMSGIGLTDELGGLSAIAFPVEFTGALAPGGEVQAGASYEIALQDLNAGAVVNVATASGTTPAGVAYTGPAAVNTQVTEQILPLVSVTKQASMPDGALGVAGEVVTFGYTLTNTGNVTLTAVSLLDRLADTSVPEYVWPDPATPGVLLPGQTVQATSLHVLTQAEVDAGGVSSAVDGVATPPRGADVTANATAGVTIAERATIAVAKQGTVAGVGAVNDTIDYAFAIQNTGNVTLTLVDLIDALPDVSTPEISWPDGGAPGVLHPGAVDPATGEQLPGEIATATARYTITQTDVDRGSVSNIATASGKPPVSDTISASSPIVLTPVALPQPGIAVTKTGELAAGAVGAVGDIVEYAFSISNTGNVTVSDVALADPLPGLSTPAIRWPGTPGTLAPDQIATATATYALTQADVDRGLVPNTAAVSATGPDGVPLSAESGPVIVETQAAAPALTALNTGALAPGATGVAGDVVTWTYRVTNTGTVTLSGVAISEALAGVEIGGTVWDGAEGVLAPGQSVVATGTSVVTQADVDAGAVSSILTGTGVAPGGGEPISASDPATVEIVPSDGLVIVKTGVLAAGAIGQVGDTIEYTLAATNTGNVTLTQGFLTDPLEGLYDVVYPWDVTDPIRALAPGETVTGTARYDITQADVDEGVVRNTATARAETPAGLEVPATSNTVVISTVLPAPGIEIVKSGTPTGAGLFDTIDYTFTVRNSGNVTLSSVGVVDELPGLSPISFPTGFAGVLAPGAEVVATADYLVQQGDIDAGAVTNVAVAAGTAPDGITTASSSSNESVVPTEAAAPAVTISNRGELAPGAVGAAGDTVVWTYGLVNSGNVTLSGVTLADALIGVDAPSYTWDGAPFVLLPGQSVTATAEYRLLQRDVDAGSVSSLVSATGAVPGGGAPVTATAPATVQILPNPGVTIVKGASLAVGGENGLADVITYDFTVQNTGTVTLTGIAISETLGGLSAITYRWPGVAGALSPGQTVTASAPYAITQSDVDRGTVSNRASVSGTPPSGAVISALSNTVSTTLEEHAPSIATVKRGGIVAGTGGAGSTVEYDFEITNTGNVTLNLIALREALPGVSVPDLQFPSATGILGPGGVATGTASYTVTQADVDRGSITNVATAIGTSPRGIVVSGVSNSVVLDTVPPANGIRTVQSAQLTGGASGVLGDRIDYRFEITNTGNQTLTSIVLANTLTDLTGVVYSYPAVAGQLAPNGTLVVTAHRVVTQADVDAGRIVNTATASGTSPSGAVVSGASAQSVVTLATASGGLTLVKTGVPRGTGVGGVVDYEFTVTNTGTASVGGIVISDPKLGAAPITFGVWPSTAGTLAPGESVMATASYAIQQGDVDGGAVRNTATVNGESASGEAVSSRSNESVVGTVAASAVIAVAKQQPLAAGAPGRAGDRVAFSFAVSNVGNVTLTGVAVADPQPRLGTLSYVWPDPARPGVLLPGQSATATANYTLTQADVDAGGISSTATASGASATSTATAQHSAATPVAAAPSYTVAKAHTVETFVQQGGGVRYRIAVTNTGNVTLSSITIADALPGLSPLAVTYPGVPGQLAPNETAVATARYVITQADVDRGSLTNEAIVSASPPAGGAIVISDADTLLIPRTASIALALDIALADGATGAVGDRLVFRHTVTNSGTETLRNVAVNNPYPGLTPLVYEWPGEAGVLLPGQSVVATATVVITPAMLGTIVTSSASVSALGPDGEVVTSVAEDSLPVLVAEPAPPPTPPVVPGLPFTGSDPGSLIASSLLLMLAGLLLALGARRRRDDAVNEISHT